MRAEEMGRSAGNDRDAAFLLPETGHSPQESRTLTVPYSFAGGMMTRFPLLWYALVTLLLCSCSAEQVRWKADALGVMETARRVRAHVVLPEEYASLVTTYVGAERLLAEGREEEAETLFRLVSGKGEMLNTRLLGEAVLREAARSLRPGKGIDQVKPAQPACTCPTAPQPAAAGSAPLCSGGASPQPPPSVPSAGRGERLFRGDTSEPRSRRKTMAPAAVHHGAVVPADTTLYLTFDDGPSPLTLPIAHYLKEAGVPATFFVVGERIRGQEKIIRDTRTLGHVVANHTQSHNIRRLRAGREALQREVESPGPRLDQIGGNKSLVRIPYGSQSVGKQLLAGLDGNTIGVIDWDIDSGDTTPAGMHDDRFIAMSVLRGLKQQRKRNVVVLFHDSSGHGKTFQALKQLIPELKKAGYHFAGLNLQSPVTWVKKRSA